MIRHVSPEQVLEEFNNFLEENNVCDLVDRDAFTRGKIAGKVEMCLEMKHWLLNEEEEEDGKPKDTSY